MNLKLYLPPKNNVGRKHKKQFRRQPGSSKAYQDAIVFDAFEFWGRDISAEREKFYLDKIKN